MKCKKIIGHLCLFIILILSAIILTKFLKFIVKSTKIIILQKFKTQFYQ